MRLNGEASGSQVIEIETSVWMHGAFDVFGCLLNLDAALTHKIFQRAQRILFVILSLDFHWRTIVKRNCAPSKRMHIFHRIPKQFVIGQTRWKSLHWKVPGFTVRTFGWIGSSIDGGLGCQMNASLLDPLFEYGEWPIHRRTLSSNTLLRRLPEPICYRHAPVPPERARCDLHAGRGLAALVFVGVHRVNGTANKLIIETHIDHFGKAAVLLDVRCQDGIQHFVRWKCIRVELV